jgi:hypothetical protein
LSTKAIKGTIAHLSNPTKWEVKTRGRNSFFRPVSFLKQNMSFLAGTHLLKGAGIKALLMKNGRRRWVERWDHDINV